jgi:hypothetical protein
MPTSLPSMPYAAALVVCAFVYFVAYPVIVYFRDVKGEQKHEGDVNYMLICQASEDIQICIPCQACL